MRILCKFFIPLFLLVSIILPSFNVQAENEKWKYYATGEDSTKHYYDLNSVEYVSDNIARVWERVTVSKTTSYLTKEMKILREIDCSRRLYRTLEMRIEYIDGSEKEKSHPDAKWMNITSQTWLETLCNIICKKK